MLTLSTEALAFLPETTFHSRRENLRREREREREQAADRGYNEPVKFITTHLTADFDAFAAAVCAARLYPDHRVLFPGSQEAAVRRFLAESAMPFPEVKLREARREQWEHAVVVDTRNPRRLGEAWDLIRRDGCPVTLIDHHVTEPEGLEAGEVISRQVGATCTIVAGLLREANLAPTPEEASLMLMGLYEDTGGLSYRDTTSEDLRVAAWLLEQGGSLEWVRRWVLKALEPEQFDLLARLVEETEEVTINGVRVAVTAVAVDRYHEEAAYVVHRWVETFDLPVGIALFSRPPYVAMILRNRVPGLHIGQLAQRFGGGGHATAASARVSGRLPVELREELLAALREELPPAPAAAEVAVHRIFTVEESASVETAKERINHLRVNALPVSEEGSGRLIGVVTRQILDRGLSHGMGERPVRAVMQPEVPTVPADTPLEELRDLFLERSYRFVVVEEAGEPVGLVTRMELLRHLFGRQHSAGSALDNRMRGARPVSQPVTALLREVPPAWVQELLRQASEVADRQGLTVYLVGGVVRDLLLGRACDDLDLVVEGDGIAFAEELARAAGGRCHPHTPFLTAVVTLASDHKVDVASARTEFYSTPAALPEVETSLIRQDLYRRDFTINSLAVVLSGGRYGQLLDFFGGRKDLHRREIRVLHSLSFIDDPTRAIRAVRYARRLGFELAADTRHLMHTAIQEGVFDELSGQRLGKELELLLAEAHPTDSLAMLAELGLLQVIVPELEWDESVRSFIRTVEAKLAWYQLEDLGSPPREWELFFGALALCGAPGTANRLAERFQLSGARRQALEDLPAEVEAIRAAADPELRRSRRVRQVEGKPVSAQLLAMAGLDLEGRRLLADAVEVSVRVTAPVAGRDLVARDIPPGKHVGEALAEVRDQLIDGEIEAGEALDLAVWAARRRLREESADQGGKG